MKPHVLAPATLAFVAACSPGTEPPPGAAVRCGDAAASSRVFIEIAYAADGMPSATPDECSVAPGTRVEWRGPAGDGRGFDIRFKRENPVPAAPGGVLRSGAADGRQVAAGVLGPTRGRYPYAIRAGSKERDPAIIIR